MIAIGLGLSVLVACSDDGADGDGAAAGDAAVMDGGGGGAQAGSGAAGRSGSGGAGGRSAGAGRGGAAGSAGVAGRVEAGTGAGGSAGSGRLCRDGSAPPCATTPGGGELCTEVGWCEVTDTKLADVCAVDDGFEEVRGVEGCAGIINDWSGGIADQARDRLIVWGGGHNGYYGNELYAFDLTALVFERLNDPSPPTTADSDCPEALADGTPNSRHTYNALVEVMGQDRMWAFGGSLGCGPGNFGDDTWLLDLTTLSWTRADDADGPNPGARPGVVADYHARSERIFLHDTSALFRYDPQQHSYEKLDDSTIDYHLTGVIDPERDLFVLFGGDQVRAFDLSAGSDFAMQNWDDEVTGCDAVKRSGYPGLAYDPIAQGIVAWTGGDSVYVFDVETKSCTEVTHAGGPGDPPEAGTHGRFRYFAKYDVFAVVNDWQQNAFTLRLRPVM